MTSRLCGSLIITLRIIPWGVGVCVCVCVCVWVCGGQHISNVLCSIGKTQAVHTFLQYQSIKSLRSVSKEQSFSLTRKLPMLHVTLETCFADIFFHLECKRSVVRSVPFFLYVPFCFRMAWPLRFLSVVVPFFDRMVNRKTIVFLKWNVNFLLTGTVHVNSA